MYKLYSMRRSGNCYKVRLALAQLDIAHELVEMDILKGETRTPEFLAMNPSGHVPVLEVAPGRYIAESNAILWYIAGHTPLVPDDRADRAEMLQWMFFEQHSLESNIGAAYFCAEDEGCLSHILIDQTNFTGFNGVWNTCAVVKTALLKKRRFRPEVFSAEDQEWSAWLFKVERKSVARISGGGMGYRNPRKHPMRTRLNENIAMALYVKPEMLGLPYLARVIYRVFRPVSAWRERVFNARLLVSLVRCQFSQPKLKSRYF